MNELDLSYFDPDQKILVAVSGGRDSVGLLRRLLSNRAELGEIGVGHINHRMRPISQRDENFVAELAQSHSLPFFVKRLDKIPRGETEAREQRYHALAELAADFSAQHIVVAHHYRDQLETRFINLLRGTSVRGLIGMSVCRSLTDSIFLVRPALRCDPAWLHQGVEQWCEDETNTQSITPRNHLRRQLLPELEKLFPRDLGLTLDTLACHLKEDEEALATLVPTEDIMSRQQFLALPRSLQRRWLRKKAPLSHEQIERGLAAVEAQQSLDLGQGVRLRIGEDWVAL